MRSLARDRGLLLVVVAAAAVRLIFLLVHTAPAIRNDSVFYHGVAVNLAHGHGYTFGGRQFARREPGYILVVAIIYRLVGVHPGAVFVVQAAAGVAACAGTYVIADRIAGRRAAVIAGLLLALSPSFLGYTDVLLTETFATFWVVAGLLILTSDATGLRLRTVLGAGVVLGVASLTRTNLLVLALVAPLLLWGLGLRPRRALERGGVVCGIALLVLAPWVVRNALTFHTFIPGNTNAGDVLWSGSYVPWNGEWRGYKPPITQLRAGLTDVQENRKLLREAIKNIEHDPAGVARVWAKKPFKMWLLSDASLYPTSPRKHHDWRLATLLGQHALWLLCLVGAAYGAARRWADGRVRLVVLVIVVSTLALLPVNPERRYVVPFYPLVYAVAAAGLVSLWDTLRRYSSRGADADVGPSVDTGGVANLRHLMPSGEEQG